MDTPTSPNLVPNSITTTFQSKDHPKKAEGISLFAFVVSIFIYVVIFYIFKLSPSKLLHDSKFWFFIANTLILIIAVDSGAFSSSSSSSSSLKHNYQHDLREEYLMRRQRSINIPAIIRPVITKKNIPEREPKDLFQDVPRFSSHHQKAKTPEKRSSSVPKKRASVVPENCQRDQKPDNSKSSRVEKPDHRARINKHDRNNHATALRKKQVTVAPKTLPRSKSQVVKRVVFDESRNIIRRVETERYELVDHIGEENDEQANEYANLSDAELNRRVEEFIQRFNRQIRLQREHQS